MHNNLNISPSHLKIVTDILVTHAPGIEVRAFGSRVKFTNGPFSDLDLVLVGNDSQPLATITTLEDAFKDSDLPFGVDVLDYCNLPDYMKKQISNQYVILVKAKQQPPEIY